MHCRYHPDREAVTVCQKMLIGYCSECMENGVTCTDPSNYCKFRPQCIIHELSRERRRANRSGSGDQPLPDIKREAQPAV